MILDAETLALSPGVAALVEWAEGRDLPGVLKMELLASMVELATGVCSSATEACEAMAALRACAAEAAAENGLVVAAAGTHAFSLPTAQQIAPDPRYLEFVKYAGVSARRQAVCGLHVHVGMASPETCMVALEGVLAWLPVVLALSANSPFLAGEETGLVSSRAEVLAQLPRAAAPPVCGSYEEREAFVERFVRQELLELVSPAARELGSDELLQALDPSRCEGDRQLEVRRGRSLEAVVADVAERTLGSKP